MKNPDVEFIKTSGRFRLVRELKFSEILSFVLEYIRKPNVFTFFYLAINILFLILFVVQIGYGFLENGFSYNTFKTFFPGLLWGTMVGSLLIIPIHEGIHALAFLIIGAKKIRFGADLKQMIFYATAENFAAGRKGFTFVAIAPFAFINLISLPFLLTEEADTRIFITIMLLLHNIMCIGDFAMMSFFREHKDLEMFTFDEIESRTAYFFGKVKE
jgi:hypothetical protein